MYSTMLVYLHFISYFDFHDSRTGGRELLWSKFFLFLDIHLIVLRNNINKFTMIIWGNFGRSAAQLSAGFTCELA